MAIVYDKLLALKSDVEHLRRDAILYALSLGLGQDPMNEDELAVRLREESESAADLSGAWSRIRASGRAISTPASTG